MSTQIGIEVNPDLNTEGQGAPDSGIKIENESKLETKFKINSKVPEEGKIEKKRHSISEKFKELRERGEGALICYIMAGDPSVESTKENVKALVAGGADIIELGFPFSDPVADGPTIQAAGQRALATGMDIPGYFELVRSLDIQIPLVCMTYYNPVFRYGLKNFVEKAAEAGIKGLIIPDVPVEETTDLKTCCEKAGIDLIFLVAPTTTEERIKKILQNGSGFLYLVSRLGVTGVRADISTSTEELLCRVKTELPKAVGFGISTGNQAKEIRKAGADAVIVGSAFVKIIEERENVSSKLEALTKELKSGMLVSS